jgi:peptidoglycan/LPS O-acetylase OafA/YrhL
MFLSNGDISINYCIWGHSNIGGFTLKICNLGGRISYPLYITHFTFLYMYLNLATNIKAPMQTLIYTGVFAFFFVLAFAWLCAKYYDEPIRKKLKQMLLK